MRQTYKTQPIFMFFLKREETTHFDKENCNYVLVSIHNDNFRNLHWFTTASGSNDGSIDEAGPSSFDSLLLLLDEGEYVQYNTDPHDITRFYGPKAGEI